MWIDVDGGAVVTATAVSFKINGFSVPPSEWVNKEIKQGFLTGYDENDEILFNIKFDCHDGGTVTLKAPGGPVEPIEVQIDIKPGSDPNPINPGSNGLIPVAIFSTDDFAATTVIPVSVEINGATVPMRGKSGKFMAHEEDLNEDGLPDLVVQVEIEGLGEIGDDGVVKLTGETTDGVSIEGYDVVVIVPPEQ